MFCLGFCFSAEKKREFQIDLQTQLLCQNNDIIEQTMVGARGAAVMVPNLVRESLGINR